MKKTDVWIVLVAIAVAGVFFAWNALASRANVQTVRISVNGELYRTITLREPQTIPINIGGKINVIEITQQGARMTEANCPDKLCVHQGEITKKSQTIVCLPNKVVVEFVDDSPGDFDSMSS